MVIDMENQEVLGCVDGSDSDDPNSSRTRQKIEKCPECGSSNLIHDYDTGETICGDCGLVVYEQMMDKGPEWRAFDEAQRKERTRVGAPTSYSVHDKGLSTAITHLDRDAFGRKLPLSTRLQMWRLRKWQIRTRVHSSVDRNLAQAMNELDRLCDKLYIPSSLKEKAAIIYRKAVDKGLVRGRSIAIVVAAALYVACRATRTPRTLREIAKASLTDKQDVGRCYRFLMWELEIKMPFPDPVGCVSKIAERTGISGKTQGLAIQLLHQVREKKFGKLADQGKDPMSMAAAALYIACLLNNEKKTQKDLADVAEVTEVTVRNRMKTIKETLNLKIPRH
jgi:transcription initiation factor TFIIB